jgi:flagellar basal-body rod modification protein FlgD
MVAPVTGAQGSAGGFVKATQRASVTRDEFLKILVAELTSQDPLNPLDNGQFVQQLVSLQSLEQTAVLTDSLRTFERFLQMTSGSSLIGKKVKGLTPAGDKVEGVVSRVVLEDEKVNLVVGAQKLSVNSVTEIVSG